MEYMKLSEAAEKWGLTSRRVRILCAENRIDGVIRRGKLYMIPVGTPRPADGRRLRKLRNDKQSDLIRSIEAKKAELNRRRPLTPGEVKKLNEQFMIEYTHDSTAIEGNTLTLRETALVLEGMTIDQKPLKDHLEAVGHKDAFLYIEEIAKQDVPLNESVIKQIHTLVLMNSAEDRGIYRRIPVVISGAYTTPVQPYLIEEKMNELLLQNGIRKQTMHPIKRIAQFHLEFEGIHPFIDGNGRTGRLIMNLDLIRNGFPAINIKFADRKKYYDAFDAFYRDKNANAMTELIAGYISERLDMFLSILE